MKEHGSRDAVLRADRIRVSYDTRSGLVPAVRGVSFEIDQGETFGLVGESGCGKSSVAFAIVGHLARNGRIAGGSILFQGQDLAGRSDEELRELRGNQMAMVSQDAMEALNPCLRVGNQLAEVLVVHQGLDRDAADERCLRILKRVYMPDPEDVMRRYPHQLSGGQQQRVVIGMALLNNPALLILDEPTTALDVTVQAAFLDLMEELQRELDTAILYITHDMGVIARISDRVGVMYAGEIVERGSLEQVLLNPMHPYTQGLLRCVTRLGLGKEAHELQPIPGRVPPASTQLPGCWFEPRCEFAGRQCRQRHPGLREVRTDHFARCFYVEDIPKGRSWLSRGAVRRAPEDAQLRYREHHALQVDHLRVYYGQEPRSMASLVGLQEESQLRAVDDVSFRVPSGATLGIVGESGCGKTTLARAVVGLESITGGRVEFLGADISVPLEQRDIDLTKGLQMVFQNPDATLNPMLSVGYQISRPLQRLETVPHGQIRQEVFRLLEAVELDRTYYDRLPRQLSGGEKQRVAIARAFAAYPELVFCDEPVSSLDVSVQAAILRLLMDIQNRRGTSLVYISHDLSVVRFLCDYVAVMYLGRICEIGPAAAIYAPPYHPYTEALLSAVPSPDPTVGRKRIHLKGTVPSPANPPNGCPFHTRCPRRVGRICRTEMPSGQEAGDGHVIYCHIPVRELSRLAPVVCDSSETSGGHE